MTTRIGDSNVVFGLTDEPWGYMQMVKVDQAPAKAEAQRGDGEVVAADYYNAQKKCSGEYIYRHVTGAPDLVVGTNTGVTLTDAGITVYIDRASEVWQMGQYRKITFEGTYYPHLGS